ncbi:MAG TPA: glutamate ABC transporter substrate-binding protein [Actinocatenispora sp.]
MRHSSTGVLRRRMALAVVALAGVAVAAAGCGGNTAAPGGGSGAKAKAGGDTADSIIASAPVAKSLPDSPTLKKIKADGKLVYGGTASAPLFSLKDPTTNTLTGFDADLAKLLAKYITGKPTTDMKQVQVETREALLQNHSVNAVFATYTITPERAQKIAFAGPYYSSGDAILVKKDNTSIKTVADLNGKKVATESSSTAAADIKKYAPKAKVQLFEENNDCLQAVQQGRVDAYVLDQGILVGDASTNTDVKVVGQPFTAEPYGIGLPKDDPAMKKFVNEWLTQIMKDGTWAKLWKATVGTVVSGDAPKPPAIGSVQGS